MTASTRCSQRARAGDGAFLRDVPDQRHARAPRLGDLRDGVAYLADLSNAPCRPAQLGAREGLDAVDHRQGGPRGEDGLDRGLQLGRGEQSEPLHYRIDPLGPSTDLARRLLAGHVQRRAQPSAARRAASCRSNVDLPIPGSPLNRTIEPGTRPPPNTRSISPIPLARRSASALETAAMARCAAAPAALAGTGGASSVRCRRAKPSRPACSRRRSPSTAQTTSARLAPHCWQT